MRRAGRDTNFIELDGKFLGVSLAPDFCAEHEHGIEGIQTMFRISRDQSVFGLARRKITALPETFLHLEQKREDRPDYLYARYTRMQAPSVGDLERCITLWEHDKIAGAWDENGFCVAVAGAENKKRLRTIADAFRNLDVAIMLGGTGNPFGGCGLRILIYSAAPEEGLKMVEDSDRDYFNLKKAAEATGIEEKLRNADKRFYALSPRWVEGFGPANQARPKTKHPVIFWLNPQQQQDNNYGWYTVEDLEAWVRNKGPIPKDEEDEEVDHAE